MLAKKNISFVISFQIMKTEIKLERSLTPQDNIKPNSDFVVLTHITAYHNNGKLKRGIKPAQPTLQTEPKKISYGFSLL